VTDRVATEDCELDGRRVRQGQLVGLILGAANRDPEHFPDPDRLDLGRTQNEHLAFGRGVHFCLGAALARLGAPGATPAPLARFPALAAGGGELRWHRSLVLRGLDALPVTLR